MRHQLSIDNSQLIPGEVFRAVDPAGGRQVVWACVTSMKWMGTEWWYTIMFQNNETRQIFSHTELRMLFEDPKTSRDSGYRYGRRAERALDLRNLKIDRITEADELAYEESTGQYCCTREYN